MAYDDPEEEEVKQPAAAPHPALQEFQAAFTHPDAQEWAGEAVARLNDYLTRRDLADANERAGQNFVNDITRFKDGLVGLVDNDPHAVGVALDLVAPTMAAIIGTMPGRPEDADAHHLTITTDMQNEIATTAIKSMAMRDEGSAHAMLANPRIQSIVGEGAEGLTNFISLQGSARARDAQMDQERDYQARSKLADDSALSYISALYNPRQDDVQFPPNWNQAVMADDRLPAAAKAGVLGLFDKLRVTGDAESSNAGLVTEAVARIASGEPPHPSELLQYVGRDIKLADALQLGHAAADPTSRRYFEQLDSTLQSARAQLAPPENGRAGEAAYQRFVNWLLPRTREGAVLNPNSKDYLLANGLHSFAPRGNDYIAPIVQARGGERRSLDDIFGKGKA